MFDTVHVYDLIELLSIVFKSSCSQMLLEMLFLKNSQYLLENISVGVSF